MSRAVPRLVVLDIDGTLMHSMQMDGELYFQAITETLGLRDIDTDWSTYRHVTDTGILCELIERQHGRPAADEEIRAVQNCFVELVDAELTARPHRCQAIDGAAAFLAALDEASDLLPCVATGAWRRSSLLKCASAGLDIERFPLATCDDTPHRASIVLAAASRARDAYDTPWDGVAVLVGDGLWDLAVSRELDMRFLGVGSGPEAARLREAGATQIIADYNDLPTVLNYLRG